MAYLRRDRPLTGAEKRQRLQDAATEILRLSLVDADPNRSRRGRNKFERQKAKAVTLMAQGKLQPFGPERPVVRAEQGVYVIGAPGMPVKIGIAADVHSRLSGIQVGCPERLKVYLFIDALEGKAREIERECHRRLDQYRVSGEWFNVDWREAAAMVREVVARSR